MGLIINPRAGGYRDVPAAGDLVRMLQEQGLDVLQTLVNSGAVRRTLPVSPWRKVLRFWWLREAMERSDEVLQ